MTKFYPDQLVMMALTLSGTGMMAFFSEEFKENTSRLVKDQTLHKNLKFYNLMFNYNSNQGMVKIKETELKSNPEGFEAKGKAEKVGDTEAMSQKAKEVNVNETKSQDAGGEAASNATGTEADSKAKHADGTETASQVKGEEESKPVKVKGEEESKPVTTQSKSKDQVPLFGNQRRD